MYKINISAGKQDSPAILQETGNQKITKMLGKSFKMFPFPTKALRDSECQNPLECRVSKDVFPPVNRNAFATALEKRLSLTGQAQILMESVKIQIRYGLI